jgi:hypothetical protein
VLTLSRKVDERKPLATGVAAEGEGEANPWDENADDEVNTNEEEEVSSFDVAAGGGGGADGEWPDSGDSGEWLDDAEADDAVAAASTMFGDASAGTDVRQGSTLNPVP